MFKVIYSHDVDVPQIRAGHISPNFQSIKVGLDGCLDFAVGWIYPCGRVEIGGCAHLGARDARDFGRPGTEVTLDPQKDMDLIRKAIVLGGSDSREP